MRILLLILALALSAQTAPITIPRGSKDTNDFSMFWTNSPYPYVVSNYQAWGAVNTNFSDIWGRIQPAWDDVRIPMASTRAGATGATRQTLTNGIGAWRFANSPEQSMEFELQTPHGMDTNYGVRLHLHWTSDAAATGVVWGMEWTRANPTAVIETPTTSYSTNTNTLAYKHNITSIVNVSNLVESGLVVGRLFRLDGDDYSGTVFGLSLDAHYVRKAYGSTNEFGDY